MKTFDIFSTNVISLYQLSVIKGGTTGPVDLNDEDIDMPDL